MKNPRTQVSVSGGLRVRCSCLDVVVRMRAETECWHGIIRYNATGLHALTALTKCVSMTGAGLSRIK